MNSINYVAKMLFVTQRCYGGEFHTKTLSTNFSHWFCAPMRYRHTRLLYFSFSISLALSFDPCVAISLSNFVGKAYKWWVHGICLQLGLFSRYCQSEYIVTYAFMNARGYRVQIGQSTSSKVAMVVLTPKLLTALYGWFQVEGNIP